MKTRSSKLFAPIAMGLFAIAAIAFYQLTQSQAFSPDSARAAVAADPTDDPATQVRPAPDFELKDLQGNTVHLSDFKGKVVVLNFWATWCPPCRKEIPDFSELQKTLGGEGLQFIGIALDDEGAAKVKPWLEKNPVAYPILLPDTKVVASYGDMTSIPVTFVIDRKGMIRQNYTGLRQRAVLEGMLKPLLAEK